MRDDTRAGLTRQTMIETALRLLDEVGLDGLTVRRLAAELGVKSPSLYWHIRTKQDLLDGMADTIIRAAGMGPPHEGESWQDWLARRARSYRRAVLAHRDGARLVATGQSLGAATIKALDQELAAMVERGFTPLLALDTIAAISRYVIGFVLQEQNERLPDRPVDNMADLLDGGTSAPLLVALRAGGSMGEAAFEHGLRTLIDGTAAALTRLPR
ncbi:TetR/AcrR family transcriptional regulator C-terminal domain-containing protein [Nonomuraea jiangxiensis]|uniref:TetR/AcrR family transcriptional regulator, tetracycline repressor protein n=1 Tax=Nonomuraea jiangxiensis TaxID=633440 RepID=A0A1G8EML4_9ACTN|nr:TetR/AcrR family transcriptional regulator C-terminal domain-containing protein [Nonomuraea jiangxiensis]SDH71144.1 TetR/AcrR family transcriptional regulator, tetracycline repressor protein [Nonomuraea jiangxiensis]